LISRSPNRDATQSATSTAGAERLRRWRARQRDGRICLSVEINQRGIDALRDAGMIREWSETDRVIIAAAVEKLITRFAGGDAGFGMRGNDDVAPRDRLLRRLAGLFTGSTADRARACWVELTCYRDLDQWKRDRVALRNPYCSGTIESLGWEILKINPHPPRLETVMEVLQKSEGQKNAVR
jgi:hypothetical protein